MELHHIVPKFLGGSDERYNLRCVSTKEHYIEHLKWALYLNTPSAWMAVNAIMNGHKELGLFRGYWRKRYSNSIMGTNNPVYGYKRPKGKNSPVWKGGLPKCINCEKKLSRRDALRCKSCDTTIKNKNRKYKTIGENNGRATMSKLDALNILSLSKTRGPTEIANITGFGYQAVYKIINKITWKHLQE